MAWAVSALLQQLAQDGRCHRLEASAAIPSHTRGSCTPQGNFRCPRRQFSSLRGSACESEALGDASRTHRTLRPGGFPETRRTREGIWSSSGKAPDSVGPLVDNRPSRAPVMFPTPGSVRSAPGPHRCAVVLCPRSLAHRRAAVRASWSRASQREDATDRAEVLHCDSRPGSRSAHGAPPRCQQRADADAGLGAMSA